MKKYRGCYIDGVVYKSKKDIDAALKRMAIEHFKISVQVFTIHPDYSHSTYVQRQAEALNSQHNLSWEEIEQIEIEAMKTA